MPVLSERWTAPCKSLGRRAKCPNQGCVGPRVETANFGWIPSVSSQGHVAGQQRTSQRQSLRQRFTGNLK